jgi:16S rRNA (cytosine967-C5)-methyltransferase
MNMGVQRRERRPTRPTVSPARLKAFETLRRVEEESSYASVLLAEDDELSKAEDRALAHEIVLGVLRWRLWLDTLIEQFSGRRVESLDNPVVISLRMALYQMRFLTRIPHRAVVNEAVNLVHYFKLKSAAGFVNAVLRRASRETDYDPASAITEPLKRLAIETSHPLWLIERWVQQFGFDETRAFATANNLPPPVAFRIGWRHTADEVLSEIERAGGRCFPSKLIPAAWRVEGGSRVLRRMAVEGKIYLQDESSQLVAHLVDPKPSESILDLCAAPGSKTTLLASLTEGQARIVAGDIHTHRLQILSQTVARQSITGVRLVALDGEAAPFMPDTFDCALVDAPCSGTGTLRRNPEIRWRITSADISEVSAKQLKMLESVAGTIKPGGRLIYSTCSVETDENERVIEKFLSRHHDFSLSVPKALSGTTLNAPFVRIWPQMHGADGFFAALMMRATTTT